MIQGKKAQLLGALSLIGVCAVLLVCLLRKTEKFAYLVELPLYDVVTEATWPWKTGHDDVVLVTIQSPDDWPLSDGKFAEILGQISKAEPKVIAVDLVRDSYRSGESVRARRDAELLDDALGWGHSLLMVQGLPGEGNEGFQVHPYFLQFDDDYQLERVGLANFPRDQLVGYKIRRGLFKTSDPNRYSLAALAAIHASGVTDQVLFDSITDFHASSGGYAIRDDEFGNQFLLKFGPEMSSVFAEFSMEEVLAMNDREIRTFLGGKVVFFGTGGIETAKDEMPVIGDPELRGVKLHALACAQLLRELVDGEAPIQTSSERQEVLLIVVFGFVAIMAFWRFRRSGVMRTVCLLLMVAVGLLVEVVALKGGVWIAMGGPLFTVLVIGAVGSVYLHHYTSTTLRAYSATLSQQFGESVATLLEEYQEELLHDGTLPSRQFSGTAFFSDLLGYTGTTERFALRGEEEAFLKWINDYISAMVPIIRRNGGVIVKFAGDGIFVIFGFEGKGGHASQALSCAREMRDALVGLNLGQEQEMDSYLVRVGIYSGPIFAGAVGSKERLSYDFLGSTVNKAARLEALEKGLEHPQLENPIRILMGDSAYSLLDGAEGVVEFGVGRFQLDTRVSERESVWIALGGDFD